MPEPRISARIATCALPGARERFEKHKRRRLAQVQSKRFRERRALAFTRRFQSLETGERAGGKGVGSASQRRVEHPAADQIGGQRHRRRAGGAGGDHRCGQPLHSQFAGQHSRAGVILPGQPLLFRQPQVAADDPFVVSFDEQHRPGARRENKPQPPAKIFRAHGGGLPAPRAPPPLPSERAGRTRPVPPAVPARRRRSRSKVRHSGI